MISFIVPAHNEAALLRKTLAAIHAAAAVAGRPYEIIVVDDDSSDATAEIACSAGVRVIGVRLRQIAAVRNAGAREATGDILIFVDADTVLPGETLAAALSAIEGGVVGGGAKLAFDGPAGWARWSLPLLNRIAHRLRWAAGCFIFVRREIFERIGGFDERYFAAEEIVLSKALKRHGPTVIVDQPVLTSGRKGSGRVLLQTAVLLLRLLLRGGKVLRQREGLGIWYGR
jgi:glycosyltransferase involved in cell wall biosynthesis